MNRVDSGGQSSKVKVTAGRRGGEAIRITPERRGPSSRNNWSDSTGRSCDEKLKVSLVVLMYNTDK